jgi:hypothetical protein
MIRKLCLSALLICTVPVPLVHGQNAAPVAQNGAPTAQSLLTGVLTQLNSANLKDATLTGRSEFVAGQTEETGTFTAQSAVDGFHRIQLSQPTTSRTDIRAVSSGVPQGFWISSQGVENTVPEHNVLVDHSWFFPQIALARLLQSSHAAFSFVGTTTKNGSSVEHFTMTNWVRPDGSMPSAQLAHIEQVDLYLDSQTLRPAILDFNMHPDSNALVDIQFEVRYSSYIEISGVWLPSHIQRYINSALNLDLTVQTAEFNTGFTESVAN